MTHIIRHRAKIKVGHQYILITYYPQLFFPPKHRINPNNNNQNRDTENQVITKPGSHCPSIIYLLHHPVFLILN